MYEEDLAKRKGGLKLKFKEIKEEFDKLVKQVVAFVPMSLKATKVERKGKRACKENGKKKETDTRKGLHTAKDEAEMIISEEDILLQLIVMSNYAENEASGWKDE
ncbi:hypothetical protein Tco_1185060 [Tanacetum coccineum]